MATSVILFFVAQLIERRSREPKIAGSSPVGASVFFSPFFFQKKLVCLKTGGIRLRIFFLLKIYLVARKCIFLNVDYQRKPVFRNKKHAVQCCSNSTAFSEKSTDWSVSVTAEKISSKRNKRKTHLAMLWPALFSAGVWANRQRWSSFWLADSEIATLLYLAVQRSIGKSQTV